MNDWVENISAGLFHKNVKKKQETVAFSNTVEACCINEKTYNYMRSCTLIHKFQVEQIQLQKHIAQRIK